MQHVTDEPFDPAKLERPDPLLLRYYVYVSLLSGPAAPLVLIPLWCRYITLRYKFDDSGVSMRWGIFFRREVYLTYRRLQDIHVDRNLLQRWMGLAKINLQTASGNQQAEMAIEGVLQPERLRDYLYSQMRGAKDPHSRGARVGAVGASSTDAAPQAVAGSIDDRVTRALLDIQSALRGLLEQKLSEKTLSEKMVAEHKQCPDAPRSREQPTTSTPTGDLS